MAIIKKLTDPPSVHEIVKTTIVKGLVVRKMIWRDTMGNEFDRTNNKFTLKKGVNSIHSTSNPPFPQPFNGLDTPLQWHISSPERSDDLSLFVFITCFLLLAFWTGTVYGSIRMSRKYKETKTRIDRETEKIQVSS
jgi:hypothetical protein